MEIIFNLIGYIIVALLVGVTICQILPSTREMNIGSRSQFVALLSSMPALLLIQILFLSVTYAEFFSMPYVDAVFVTLQDHAIGQSWLYTMIIWLCLILNVLFFYKRNSAVMAWINLVGIVLMIVVLSGASHGASVAGSTGWLANSLHLIGMAFWIGPLFVVSLYGARLKRPHQFQRIFSVLALFSLLFLIASGFILMGEMAPDYVNSWMLSYGQLLLIKHLLFLPLLIFGFRHMLSLSGKGVHLDTAERMRSFRMESLFALTVFAVTAWMTETEPPHNVLRTLQFEPMNAITSLFLREPLLENQLLSFTPSGIAIVLFICAIALLMIAIIAAWRVRKTFMTSSFLLGFVGCMYIATMLSLTPGAIPVNLTLHETMEEAIHVGYEETDDVVLLTALPRTKEDLIVLYRVNDRDLVAERLKKEADGYRKYLDATVKISGGFFTYGEQFMETFMFLTNDWFDQPNVNTYVSIGFVPQNIATVEIVFPEKTMRVDVSDQVFFSAITIEEPLTEAHHYRLLDAQGKVVEEVNKRQLFHEGHHH
ncbi:copper resistance D family protein [Shouchella lonarensis]|uniref:Putative copper resistance protein D n=1 Tax=Shouchella lonarensis TaxID=1464122 RepID=A0A1G6HBP8_9BACI|nr:CopD family protein [Shouchella lonarensis]SDB91690.1 putative copper resistance protein D [Shouchella lonarensis]